MEKKMENKIRRPRPKGRGLLSVTWIQGVFAGSSCFLLTAFLYVLAGTELYYYVFYLSYYSKGSWIDGHTWSSPPVTTSTSTTTFPGNSVAKGAPLWSKHLGFARGGCSGHEWKSSTNLVALILRYETERWALRAVMTEMNDTMKGGMCDGKASILFVLFILSFFFLFHLCMMA